MRMLDIRPTMERKVTMERVPILSHTLSEQFFNNLILIHNQLRTYRRRPEI